MPISEEFTYIPFPNSPFVWRSEEHYRKYEILTDFTWDCALKDRLRSQARDTSEYLRKHARVLPGVDDEYNNVYSNHGFGRLDQ